MREVRTNTKVELIMRILITAVLLVASIGIAEARRGDFYRDPGREYELDYDVYDEDIAVSDSYIPLPTYEQALAAERYRRKQKVRDQWVMIGAISFSVWIFFYLIPAMGGKNKRK